MVNSKTLSLSKYNNICKFLNIKGLEQYSPKFDNNTALFVNTENIKLKDDNIIPTVTLALYNVTNGDKLGDIVIGDVVKEDMEQNTNVDTINNMLVCAKGNDGNKLDISDNIDCIGWLMDNKVDGIHNNVDPNVNVMDSILYNKVFYDKYKDEVKFTNGHYNDTLKRFYAKKLNNTQLHKCYTDNIIPKDDLHKHGMKFNCRHLMGLDTKKLSRNDDGTFDYDGDVCIDKDIHKFISTPLKFNKVSGNYILNELNDENIKYTPKHVGGSFKCLNSIANIIDMTFSPKTIGGDCILNNIGCESLNGLSPKIGGSLKVTNMNNIQDFVGMPDHIGKTLAFNYCNNLKSLFGCISKVNGDFKLNGNPQLESLKCGPDVVNGCFDVSECAINDLDGMALNINGKIINVSDNKLTTLNGIPDSFNKILICNNNNISNLDKCPKGIESLYISDNPLTDINGISKSIKFIKATESANLKLKSTNKLLCLLDKGCL